MQAKHLDVLCSMTITEILMYLLDSLTDSDSIRCPLGLSVKSLFGDKEDKNHKLTCDY